MSSVTRICPSQAADAPIPIVSTLEDFAIDAATGSTMPSMTIPKTPASASALESMCNWPTSSEVRPVIRKSLPATARCGNNPICPRTGIPDSTRH